ncbi:MAG: efflux RND transporter periplasmic adaptor subunit [Chloroflexi bacterium]|nr:efflux RND transporter periplasmic adaptor subunit [Chloroflexota bacterium]
MKKQNPIFLTLAILAILLSACGSQQATATPSMATPVPASDVIAEAHFVPARYATLSFLARGGVAEVNVQIGDTVKAGDVLARLDSAAPAEAQVVELQQAYDSLLRNASADHAAAWQAYMNAQKVRETATKKWNDINLRDIEKRIEDRQKDVDDRKADLDKAQANFDAVKDRGKDDSNYRAREDDLEHAQADYDEAVKDLESTIRERDVPRANLDAALAAEAEAKYQYEISLDGPNKDKLALIKSQLAAAQSTLTNYVITAPFDGVVMDVSVSVGDQAGPEAYAVKIADTSAWYVETSDLTELDVVKISQGQSAAVVADALPEVTMHGTVETISQAYTLQSGDILYKVKLKVEDVDPRVLWGMTVEVTFTSGK